ncbi:MAG: phosphatidate cytidylyltransferase, partial [Planctomycetota bacterium]
MLRDRLLFGPFFVLAVVGVFWLDELVATVTVGDRTLPAATVLLPAICVALSFASWELSRILRENGVLASTIMSVAASLAGVLATTAGGSGGPVVSSAAIGVLLMSLLYFARDKSFEGIVAGTGGVLLSFTYLGILGGFWILLRLEHSAWVCLWVVLVTKSCDIGAYFTGRSLGKRKLAPWLSPGKTQEGLVGGVVTAAIVSALGLVLLRRVGVAPDLSIAGALATGAAVALLGQVGDLVASMFKRDAGRKDASRSLPGFGGWLDVLDSPLLVGVIAFWALRL